MFKKIKNFIYWGWKCRNIVAYDGYDVYYLLHVQLTHMLNYFIKKGHCVWSSDENNTSIRKLKIARFLADRLYKDEYTTNQTKHRDKWGEIVHVFCEKTELGKRLYIYRENVLKNPSLAKKEKEESLKAFKDDDLQKSNEKAYLFKLLNKHLETWWD